MGKRFTEKEIDFIKDNVGTMFYGDIAKALNRPIVSISYVSRRLGLNSLTVTKRRNCKTKGKLLVDVTGLRFSKLTVQKFLLTKDTGHSMWLCTCDCGQTKEVYVSDLTSGKVGSCGCMKFDKQYESIKKNAYRQHLANTKKRKLTNLLSFEEYVLIASNPCEYCGDISIRKNKDTKATLPLNSVDRINNGPTYTVDTAQSVCFTCQSMKEEHKHLDFLVHLNKIKIHLYGK